MLLFAAGSAPKFVNAALALVAPVPPFAIAIVVPLQIPEVIVPTPVKLEFNTLLASVVPVNVFASAAIIISALPSNAIPFIFFVAANLVAVPALPVIFPVTSPVTFPVKLPAKFVDVTVLNPANAFVVAPKAIFVDPIVKALLANLLFAMAVPLQTPLVIVPTLVKLEFTTLLAKVVPVKVFASAAIVISALPSNATPLIFFVVANFVAVDALPARLPTTSPVTLPVKLPVTLPVNAPEKPVAVTVPFTSKAVVGLFFLIPTKPLDCFKNN